MPDNNNPAKRSLSFDDSGKKAFRFSYKFTAFAASLDDQTITLLSGSKTQIFPTKNLRHFYLKEAGNLYILTISYEAGNGKLKRADLCSHAEDAQMLALNEVLENDFPDCSLNKLSEAAAFQEMDQLPPAGVMVTIISILLFIILIVAIVMNWPR